VANAGAGERRPFTQANAGRAAYELPAQIRSIAPWVSVLGLHCVTPVNPLSHSGAIMVAVQGLVVLQASVAAVLVAAVVSQSTKPPAVPPFASPKPVFPTAWFGANPNAFEYQNPQTLKEMR
jgi:hypothetical protein